MQNDTNVKYSPEKNFFLVFTLRKIKKKTPAREFPSQCIYCTIKFSDFISTLKITRYLKFPPFKEKKNPLKIGNKAVVIRAEMSLISKRKDSCKP